MCKECIPHQPGNSDCPCSDCYLDKWTALCPTRELHPEHCAACFDDFCCHFCEQEEYKHDGSPDPTPHNWPETWPGKRSD